MVFWWSSDAILSFILFLYGLLHLCNNNHILKYTFHKPTYILWKPCLPFYVAHKQLQIFPYLKAIWNLYKLSTNYYNFVIKINKLQRKPTTTQLFITWMMISVMLLILGNPAKRRDLDLMILLGPFQLGIFFDSINEDPEMEKRSMAFRSSSSILKLLWFETDTAEAVH